MTQKRCDGCKFWDKSREKYPTGFRRCVRIKGEGEIARSVTYIDKENDEAFDKAIQAAYNEARAFTLYYSELRTAANFSCALFESIVDKP